MSGRGSRRRWRCPSPSEPRYVAFDDLFGTFLTAFFAAGFRAVIFVAFGVVFFATGLLVVFLAAALIVIFRTGRGFETCFTACFAALSRRRRHVPLPGVRRGQWTRDQRIWNML